MNSTIIPFGKLHEEEVSLYVLENKQGLQVKIMNYGATITSISVPDQQGGRVELACGFDTFEEYFSEAYLKNAPYFGCTVGRYASRIKDGKFTINGKNYQVACNDGPNHLHGGVQGFDKRIWTAEWIMDQGREGVSMRLSSPAMEEGYPGHLEVEVFFRLGDNNTLTISYEGTTDEETPLSLTNHTYFNLSGFQDTILRHQAQVSAGHHLKPDETNVPVGALEALDGLAADLRKRKPLQQAIAQMETGFEHYFLFDKGAGELAEVASFEDPHSGRKLAIATTEPGMLFYTGYFTSDELKRSETERYGRFRGFCCETHRYPNGPNIPGSPGSTLSPGEHYQSTTTYHFSF
ncbi:MAG: galactose mutarotase [Saprospiraceae bacterium]|nr:galactose mutarotase [Saprospiraceae bacterium]